MIQIILTSDNSKTAFDPNLNASYRSVNGASVESRHVFIDGCGLSVVGSYSSFNILELGFGVARNFIESFLIAKANNLELNYFTFEKNVLNFEIFEEIYAEESSNRQGIAEALKIVEKAINLGSSSSIDKRVQLKIITEDFLKIEDISDCVPVNINAIYHDPFGPKVCPELWTYGAFSRYLSIANSSTLLATYSTAGATKRALASAGFEVTLRPGPKGKRQVLTARLRDE